MRYSIIFTTTLAAGASAHSVVRAVYGGNGVIAPGSCVRDGTVRKYASNGSGAQADTSMIRPEEIAKGESPMGWTQGQGSCHAETNVNAFMSCDALPSDNTAKSGVTGKEDPGYRPEDGPTAGQAAGQAAAPAGAGNIVNSVASPISGLLGGGGGGVGKMVNSVTSPISGLLGGGKGGGLFGGIFRRDERRRDEPSQQALPPNVPSLDQLQMLPDLLQSAANLPGVGVLGLGGLPTSFEKETIVRDTCGDGAKYGIPTTFDNGEVKLLVHVVNQDGTGPYNAKIDPTSGGKDESAFVSATVTRNIPGVGLLGLGAATMMEFLVRVQMPEGMLCQGTVGGVNNLCIICIENSGYFKMLGAIAGPFGGCAYFQQSDAVRQRALGGGSQ